MNNPQIFVFPQGILGFEKYHKYELLRDNDSALAQLISQQDKEIGFILIPPGLFFADYLLKLGEEEKSILKLTAETEKDLEVWCIITNSNDLNKVTVNLRAPVVLNLQNNLALQMVLNDEKYLVRQPLIAPGGNEEGAVR